MINITKTLSTLFSHKINYVFNNNITYNTNLESFFNSHSFPSIDWVISFN